MQGNMALKLSYDGGFWKQPISKKGGRLYPIVDIIYKSQLR